jgi:hypothetical protein
VAGVDQLTASFCLRTLAASIGRPIQVFELVASAATAASTIGASRNALHPSQLDDRVPLLLCTHTQRTCINRHSRGRQCGLASHAELPPSRLCSMLAMLGSTAAPMHDFWRVRMHQRIGASESAWPAGTMTFQLAYFAPHIPHIHLCAWSPDRMRQSLVLAAVLCADGWRECSIGGTAHL